MSDPQAVEWREPRAYVKLAAEKAEAAELKTWLERDEFGGLERLAGTLIEIAKSKEESRRGTEHQLTTALVDKAIPNQIALMAAEAMISAGVHAPREPKLQRPTAQPRKGRRKR